MRRAVVLGLAVATLLAACADDGNDRSREADTLAAPVRTDADTVPQPSAVEASADAVAGRTPPEQTAPAVEPTGVVVPVTALDNSFRPEVVEVEVEVDDEVLWENRGVNNHNVLYVDGDD